MKVITLILVFAVLERTTLGDIFEPKDHGGNLGLAPRPTYAFTTRPPITTTPTTTPMPPRPIPSRLKIFNWGYKPGDNAKVQAQIILYGDTPVADGSYRVVYPGNLELLMEYHANENGYKPTWHLKKT